MPLTNQQYARIERVYEERRRQARNSQAERREEIAVRLPGVAECNEKRRRLSVEKAAAQLAGDSAKAEALETAIRRQTVLRDSLLEEAGYPKDYTEIRYRCPLCGDTGTVRGEKCRCFRQVMVEVFYQGSPLWEAVKRENFGTFSYKWFDDTTPLEELQGRTVRENMRRHVRTVKNMIAKFPEEKQNLLLTGPVGTGKTFLCNALADALMQEGYSVLYMTAGEYFDEQAEISFKGKDDEFRKALALADLLILDDLGMENANSFVQTMLFRTVNERLLQGLPTVISTNLSMNQILEQYSERVASRIMGSYTVLRFAGADVRFLKRQSGN